MRAITFLDRPPAGDWHILDVMRKDDPGRPFRRGRPRNIWVALLIDCDPDAFCAGEAHLRAPSCFLDLGRHKTREDAWDFAEQCMATRH